MDSQLINQLLILLNDAQRVAKIGSWSYNLMTKKVIWTDEMYQIFPEKIELGPPDYDKHKSTIHPEDVDYWSQAYDKTIQDGIPVAFRYRVINEERIVWVEERGHAKKDENGVPIEVFGTCQDVTEKVLAEQKLSQERLKALQSSKMAAIGEMSASIIHEINNPLAVLATNVMQFKKIENLDAKSIERVQRIERSIDKITKIIVGMKRFVRNSGEDEKVNKPISGIVNEAVALTDHRAKKFDVTVEVKLHSDHNILCDEVSIEQVIINLVNNAIDAIKNLNERWVRIEVGECQSGSVKIQIIDSGGGLPPAVRQRLFEPYFTTKSIGEGTGLGLSISRDIVEGHQGAISVDESSVNTCFVLTFPKAA